MAKNLTTVTVTINQPVERVWDALMNPDNLKFWLTGFVSFEHISGEYGRTGSVSKLIFSEGGKEIEVTETAVLIKPNQQYTFKMTSIPFDVDTDIRLISLGSRTEMIQTTQFFPKQFMLKVMTSLMKSADKKRTESELIRFKQFAETNLKSTR